MAVHSNLSSHIFVVVSTPMGCWDTKGVCGCHTNAVVTPMVVTTEDVCGCYTKDVCGSYTKEWFSGSWETKGVCWETKDGCPQKTRSPGVEQ